MQIGVIGAVWSRHTMNIQPYLSMYMVSFAQNFVYARTYTPYELFTDYTWCDNDYWYKFEPAVAFFAIIFFLY